MQMEDSPLKCVLEDPPDEVCLKNQSGENLQPQRNSSLCFWKAYCKSSLKSKFRQHFQEARLWKILILI